MKSLGHKLFYAVLIVSVLMVNPPIVFWFNDSEILRFSVI